MNPVRCSVMYKALLGSGKKHNVQNTSSVQRNGGSLLDYVKGGA